MKNEAVILEQFGGVEHFTMAERTLEEPEEGEVRIRIVAASINPVDFKTRQGHLGGSPPMILGVEAAGIIDAVGPGVSHWLVGDEVYAFVDPAGPASNGAYPNMSICRSHSSAAKPGNSHFPRRPPWPWWGQRPINASFKKPSRPILPVVEMKPAAQAPEYDAGTGEPGAKKGR